ncbi:MAG: hypothetical protein AB7N70_00860 [Dehalococcoidia bacterium]
MGDDTARPRLDRRASQHGDPTGDQLIGLFCLIDDWVQAHPLPTVPPAASLSRYGQKRAGGSDTMVVHSSYP